MPSRKEIIAWAAGILDGEGCVTLCKNSHQHCQEYWFVRVTISQVDVRMLDRLKEHFGGTISWGGQPKKITWRRQRKWALSGPKAVAFLKLVLPLLTVKREQAELAILSIKYKGTRGVKHSANLEQYRWLAKQLSELKRVPVENIGQSVPPLAMVGD